MTAGSSHDWHSGSPVSTEELLTAAGIEVTEEGKARAKKRLDRATAARTPQRRDALRAKDVLPPKRRPPDYPVGP